ncbi:hypothetical protein [Paenibacillus sp. FSL R7-0331]|uniref:hypothetical protein n=1 Tax=Paenibacillus sp. FSL R7-0331 TaxID=1536773 RepID=UPI000AB707DE|nr:hypothetical protein [Paenibacillus sp. FSL R7-0331]
MKLLDIFKKNEVKPSCVKREIEHLGRIREAFELNDIESLLDLHRTGLGKRGDDLHGHR